MTEIELNRLSHLIDPQLHIWGWEIPVYLFLGGVTAGVMILAPLLMRQIEPNDRSKWLRWIPFFAPILLSLGMVALFLDLSYKTHVLRFYAAFRLTSPMSWGSWILLAIYPATLLLGLSGLSDVDLNSLTRWKPLKLLRGGSLIPAARRFALSHLRGLQNANIALGIALGGYTGLLLGTLGARSVWNSSILAPLFLVSGISTGAALIMLFPLTDKEHHTVRRFDVAAISLELALIFFYILGLWTGGTGGRTAAALFLGGKYTATFWTLVVIAGLAVPLIIELIEAARKLRPTLFAPALLLVGGLSLRFILVAAGQG